MTGRPLTPGRSIARALDGLAAEIAGEREPDPSGAARGGAITPTRAAGGDLRHGGQDHGERGGGDRERPDGAAADRAGRDRTDPGGRDPVRRSALLRGAALLTGRGDLAQDATHAASARARPASGERSVRTRLYAEVLRVVRAMPPDA